MTLDEYVSGITPQGGTDHLLYTYDGLNRLTSAGGPTTETFTLDGASNITSRTGPTASWMIDGSDRPTTGMTWSDADRLLNRGSDSFTYDALDRLSSSNVASTPRSYAYNGDGLLQSRSPGPTTLLWDPASSPSRLLQVGTDKIVYGLGPLYIATATGFTALARDGQKSIRAEVNGAAVTSSWRYRAYGEIAQSSGTPTPTYLGYAGQLLDPSGLYYMRARWYDASSSRFMSRDPMTGDPRTPAVLNAFAYAHANPIVNSDPTGLFCVTLSIAGSASAGADSKGGGAATVTLSLVVCGGGSAGWQVAVAGTTGAFIGKPSDSGLVPTQSDNRASGAFIGAGIGMGYSPQATTASDLDGEFADDALNVGLGPLKTGAEHASGNSRDGRAIDLWSAALPLVGFGLGASFTSMHTWTTSRSIWSESRGWLR